MKIGGLQAVSLLDYPQKVAAIIFTSGCNMRCPFCHNPNLVLPQKIKSNKSITQEEVLVFLKLRRKYLDGVVITGGEPALQPDIVDFCRQIKDLGYDIKFDTNGTFPKVVKKLIDESLVSYLAMDVKGPMDQLKKFIGAEVNPADIIESIRLIMSSGLPYEFRSTLVNGLHEESDISAMADLILGAELYILQNFQSRPELVGQDFLGRPFSSQELERFRDLCLSRVKNCLIR